MDENFKVKINPYLQETHSKKCRSVFLFFLRKLVRKQATLLRMFSTYLVILFKPWYHFHLHVRERLGNSPRGVLTSWTIKQLCLFFFLIFRCSKLILLYLFLLTDNEILTVLNNGTIKELKKLQGVGQKRAKLIADWRTVYGPFQKVNSSPLLLYF